MPWEQVVVFKVASLGQPLGKNKNDLVVIKLSVAFGVPC